jgi:hypothetical protein
VISWLSLEMTIASVSTYIVERRVKSQLDQVENVSLAMSERAICPPLRWNDGKIGSLINKEQAMLARPWKRLWNKSTSLGNGRSLQESSGVVSSRPVGDNWSVPRSSTREIVGEGGLTGQLNASCSRGRVRGKSTFSGMPLAGASESRFRRRIRWMAEVPGEAGGEEEEADTIVVAVGGMGRIEESAPSRLRGVGGGEKGKEGVC